MAAISKFPEPIRIPESEHGISRNRLSSASLKVLDQLYDAGYDAYLVGGCVRDLILGIEPKDFDIATSATPAEVKSTFRSCRLIGRRFRLAHVRIGREILEVATFRALDTGDTDDDPEETEEFHSEDDWREPGVDAEALSATPDEAMLAEPELDDHGDHDAGPDEASAAAPDDGDEDDLPEAVTAAEPPAQPTRRSRRSRKNGPFDDDAGERETVDGRIVRDNVYGTLEEDAFRRDFTINSLYYDGRDGAIVDFTGGLADLKTGALRLIGDPTLRYREDPVRMLRALRFASKLDLRIEQETSAAIYDCAALIESMPPARLYEETLKLLLSGAAVRAYGMLRQYGLFGHLFPDTDACVIEDEYSCEAKLVELALRNTDERIKAGKPVTPAFLFASLLWPAMRQDAVACEAQGMSPLQAIESAGADVLARQAGQVSLPKRFSLVTREIWTMQARLMKDRGRRAIALLGQARFRAAYDLLLLRAEAGEEVAERADWWTAMQRAEGEELQRLAEKAVGSGKGQRKRRNKDQRPRDPDAQPLSNESTGLPSGDGQIRQLPPIIGGRGDKAGGGQRRAKGQRKGGGGGNSHAGQGGGNSNKKQRRRGANRGNDAGGGGPRQDRAQGGADAAPEKRPQGPESAPAAAGEGGGGADEAPRKRHPRRRRRRRGANQGSESQAPQQAPPAQN